MRAFVNARNMKCALRIYLWRMADNSPTCSEIIRSCSFVNNVLCVHSRISWCHNTSSCSFVHTCCVFIVESADTIILQVAHLSIMYYCQFILRYIQRPPLSHIRYVVQSIHCVPRLLQTVVVHLCNLCIAVVMWVSLLYKNESRADCPSCSTQGPRLSPPLRRLTPVHSVHQTEYLGLLGLWSAVEN